MTELQANTGTQADHSMDSEQVRVELAKLNPNWADIDELKINRTFGFEKFTRALEFVNKVGALAEKMQHHPDLHIYYNQVVVELWSHDVQGLSNRDFALAAQIDALFASIQP